MALVRQNLFWEAIVDKEMVPEGFCNYWGLLTQCYMCLGIPSKVVSDYEYVNILIRFRLSGQLNCEVIYMYQFQRSCGYDGI